MMHLPPPSPPLSSTSSPVSTRYLGDLFPEQDGCEKCEKNAASGWVCSQCDGAAFCSDICWDTWDLHKTPRRAPKVARKAHEKVKHEVYQRISKVFRQHENRDHDRDYLQEAEAKWFGIYRNHAESMCVGNTERFVRIMDEGLNSEVRRQFPSLVPFIGQTGAGKSTIINLLMTFQASLVHERILTPVSGCPGDPKPTTGDVHLYPDPATHKTGYPLLFADCEGFDGGDQTPVALEGVMNGSVLQRPDQASGKITWIGKKAKRGDVVASLFPKLLYTFSDVVVYTLAQAKTLEKVAAEWLIPWAANSIYSSLNQPAQPHVIIVLNATRTNGLQKEDWMTENSTEKYIGALNIGFENYAELVDLAEELREDGNISIETIAELLQHYYASVTVILIPEDGHIKLMDEQVRALYATIKDKSGMVQRSKEAARMLLDADRFNQFLTLAIDHFSHKKDEPFDFMSEALQLNPLPGTFGGNFLQLASVLHHAGKLQSSKPVGNPKELFTFLGPIASSYIALDAERSRLYGPYIVLFKSTYRKHLWDALDYFCGRWLRCTYEKKGAQCCNSMAAHEKGHQGADGKLLGPGQFKNEFLPEEFFEEWIKGIQSDLHRIDEDIRKHGPQSNSISKAADLHRDRMKTLVSKVDNPANLISIHVCFCCLRYDMPQHLLPCGHALCDDCIKIFNCERDEDNGRYTLRCPFHTEAKQRYTITVKPQHVGPRILCLDGGGVRGIIQLAMLRAIEDVFIGYLKIQWLFDLVVGTSTGGITALSIFASGRSLKECTEDFRLLCSKAFVKREFKRVPVLGKLMVVHHGSIYKTKPLVSLLKQHFADDILLFHNKGALSQSPVKVAVTSTDTTTKQRPIIFTNYNRPLELEGDTQAHSYHLAREDCLKNETKIWEAARATSAAFPYFKPFKRHQTNKSYVDGALYNNCPVEIANNERRLLWGDITPDVFLSLGTGQDTLGNEFRNWEIEGANSRKLKNRHLFAEAWAVMKGLLDNILECEGVWEQFIEDKSRSNTPDVMSRYIRMNVEITGGVPQLDKYKEVKRLEDSVTKEATSRAREIAHRLVASCFYFSPSPETWTSKNTTKGPNVQGHIKCRFDEKSEQLKGLGSFLRDCLGKFEPTFYLQRSHDHTHEKIKTVDPISIKGMCNPGTFSMPIEFRSPLPAAVSLFVQLQEGDYGQPDGRFLPISGSPHHLSDKKPGGERTTHKKAA